MTASLNSVIKEACWRLTGLRPALEASRLTTRPTAWHKCHHCGTSFPGRTNRLYCSHRCKRAAERTRNKLSMLGARVLHSLHAEKEALAEGGERYHEVRYIR